MSGIMSKFSLEGKRAIVTGGTRGLGHGMAEGLMDAGCEAAIVGTGDKVHDVAEAFRARGFRCHGVKADLGKRDEIDRCFSECREALGGRVDILLNAAGIQFRAPAVDFPPEEWRRIIDVNLSALFYMSQLAARTMIAQGNGRIINIASMCSFFGSTLIPAYTASKSGVAGLTKALSNEWAGKGVNVNAIAPGYMATELTASIQETNPKQYEEVTGRIPLGRWGKPEDLQGLCVFLASDASAYITGAVIPVDGGYLGK